MIAVSQWIWVFFESVEPASSSELLRSSEASLSSAMLESPLGESVIFLKWVLWCCGRFCYIDGILSMNNDFFGFYLASIIFSTIGGIISIISRRIRVISVGVSSQFFSVFWVSGALLKY